MNCTVCNGELAVLGTLGNRTHFRCIQCGSEESFLSDQVDELLDEGHDAVDLDTCSCRTKH